MWNYIYAGHAGGPGGLQAAGGSTLFHPRYTHYYPNVNPTNFSDPFIPVLWIRAGFNADPDPGMRMPKLKNCTAKDASSTLEQYNSSLLSSFR